MPGAGMSWGMGLGWIGMVLVFIFLVLAIVWLFRALDRGDGSHGERGGNPDTAVDVLRERYARGELGREEFQSRKRDLES